MTKLRLWFFLDSSVQWKKWINEKFVFYPVYKVYVVDTQIVISSKNRSMVLTFYCFPVNVFVLSISGHDADLQAAKDWKM